MKKKLKLISLIFCFFLGIMVLAQSSGGDNDNVFKIIKQIISFMFSLFLMLSIPILIFLGIKYISGWGEARELNKLLFYVVIGVVILVLSLFIPNLIKNFFDNIIGGPNPTTP